MIRYDSIFDQAIERLHSEGRYRVFIDILRNKGMFPNARCFAGHNGPKPITVWCSNDYLAMGQHPKVIAAMEEALHDVGAGSGNPSATERTERSVTSITRWIPCFVVSKTGCRRSRVESINSTRKPPRLSSIPRAPGLSHSRSTRPPIRSR